MWYRNYSLLVYSSLTKIIVYCYNSTKCSIQHWWENVTAETKLKYRKSKMRNTNWSSPHRSYESWCRFDEENSRDRAWGAPATPHHWRKEERRRITSDLLEEEDGGKSCSALFLLCVRERRLWERGEAWEEKMRYLWDPWCKATSFNGQNCDVSLSPAAVLPLS
jgi:hypothetical protein